MACGFALAGQAPGAAARSVASTVAQGMPGGSMERDYVGGLVPGLELLPDLTGGPGGGELVEDGLGFGGMVPCRGLGRGFAAMIAPTSVA